MAGLWGLHSYRQQTWDSNLTYPPVFHLYLLHYHGLPTHRVYDHGLLGKYEELYPQRPQEPSQILVAYSASFLIISHLERMTRKIIP